MRKILSPDGKGVTEGAFSVMNFTCVIFLLLIFVLDLTIPLGVAIGVLYVVPVLLSLSTPQKKVILTVALLSTLLILAAFFYKPSVAEMWKVVFNRGISLFAVWVTTILGLKRKRAEQQRNDILVERERALDEVKVLKGFLPICASCKKIRDDNGYWRQIEAYIKEHSEAEFSHGLCPDCVKKLYPDL